MNLNEHNEWDNPSIHGVRVKCRTDEDENLDFFQLEPGYEERMYFNKLGK